MSVSGNVCESRLQEMSVNLDLPTSISECQKSVGFWALLYCSLPLVGSQVVGDDQGPTKK